MKEATNKNNFTYEDYIKLPEGERVELINGSIYAMPPAPSRAHQKLVTEISRKIGNHIEKQNGNCEIYVAPFDVRFVEDGETDEKNKNTVQPDISVICDKSKLDDKGCMGAPDFIIEVVSPSNSSVDYVKKVYLYEKFKVREYWIINPISKTVTVYRLNIYELYGEPEKFSFEDRISVGIYENLELVLSELI